MLQKCGESLLRAIYDPDSTEEQINESNELFLEKFKESSIEEANRVLADLTEAFNCGDPCRSGFVASICSYMVEAGCDPSCFGEPLIRKLEKLLKSSLKLFDVCVLDMKENTQEEADRDLFEEVRIAKSQEMPEETVAWDTLDRFWPATISFFEKNSE